MLGAFAFPFEEEEEEGGADGLFFFDDDDDDVDCFLDFSDGVGMVIGSCSM